MWYVICDITSFEELLSLKRKSSIDSVHSKRVRSYLSSHQLRCVNTHRVNKSLGMWGRLMLHRKILHKDCINFQLSGTNGGKVFQVLKWYVQNSVLSIHQPQEWESGRERELVMGGKRGHRHVLTLFEWGQSANEDILTWQTTLIDLSVYDLPRKIWSPVKSE